MSEEPKSLDEVYKILDYLKNEQNVLNKKLMFIADSSARLAVEMEGFEKRVHEVLDTATRIIEGDNISSEPSGKDKTPDHIG